MASERREQGFVFTGWHMVLVMVLFFGTIISVNLIMAWNASHSWSGLVVPNTYVASQQFNGKVAEAKRLAASGIEGSLTVEGRRIAYRVVDAKGAPVVADEVMATFKRPVDGGQWVVDISTTRDGAKVFHQTVRIVAGGMK